MDDDLYTLLGVDASADAKALRRAWRKLALASHPDRGGVKATFQRIAAAYAVLSDPHARAVYDLRRPKKARRPPTTTTTSEPAPRRRAPRVLLQRLSGPLNALIASGVAACRDVEVIDLFLTDDEIENGGMATIAMRVPMRCPACVIPEPCAQCGATRTIDELYTAWLSIPPNVDDGAVITPARARGMLQPLAFRVHHR